MSLAINKSSGVVTRATAPRLSTRAAHVSLSDESIEIVARMSPDELAMFGSTEGLPTVLAMRVAAAKRFAANAERAGESRPSRWDAQQMLVSAARDAVTAADDAGKVLAMNRLRAALDRAGAA